MQARGRRSQTRFSRRAGSISPAQITKLLGRFDRDIRRSCPERDGFVVGRIRTMLHPPIRHDFENSICAERRERMAVNEHLTGWSSRLFNAKKAFAPLDRNPEMFCQLGDGAPLRTLDRSLGRQTQNTDLGRPLLIYAPSLFSIE